MREGRCAEGWTRTRDTSHDATTAYRRMVSPSSPGLPANVAPARQRPWVRTLISAASGLVLLVWSVFFIAWLALRRLILPHIGERRPIAERRADGAASMADVTATAPTRGAAPSPCPRPPI
jgi:predicted cobalt transporter CbtA